MMWMLFTAVTFMNIVYLAASHKKHPAADLLSLVVMAMNAGAVLLVLALAVLEGGWQ